ncbi:hypothetical protein ACHAWF_003456 [Thalassiosira exigua]
MTMTMTMTMASAQISDQSTNIQRSQLLDAHLFDAIRPRRDAARRKCRSGGPCHVSSVGSMGAHRAYQMPMLQRQWHARNMTTQAARDESNALTHGIFPSHRPRFGARSKTMGFADLALVSPRDAGVLRRHKVAQRASGAKDVLSGARIFHSLEEAVRDRSVVCGTGMPFDMYRTRSKREYAEPRAFFEKLMASGQTDDRIDLALVFGAEQTGMEEADIDRCDVMLGIPTNPAFGSLNLAAAVQLIAYDWRVAVGGHDSYGSVL